MIKLLMKYDIKKMTQILIYFYIGAIVLAIITRLINLGSHIQAVAIIGQVFAGLTYSAIGSVIINTFIHILKVFIDNFYKDESYLTHTLPVTKNQLFASKFLSGTIVTFASLLVCLTSLMIIFLGPEFLQWFSAFVNTTVAGFTMPTGIFLALIVLLVFLQIFALLGMSFCAIVKANTYNTKRFIKGIAWFVGYYLGSMLAVILTTVIVFAIGGNLGALGATLLSQSSLITIIIIAIVIYLLCISLFYFLANKMFNKGVNVD